MADSAEYSAIMGIVLSVLTAISGAWFAAWACELTPDGVDLAVIALAVAAASVIALCMLVAILVKGHDHE